MVTNSVALSREKNSAHTKIPAGMSPKSLARGSSEACFAVRLSLN